MDDNICPNCKKNLNEFENNSVLNIFNIGKPEYRERQLFCSDTCLETKIRNAPKEAQEYYPFVIPEKVIVGFMKGKNKEYSVIVDL